MTCPSSEPVPPDVAAKMEDVYLTALTSIRDTSAQYHQIGTKATTNGLTRLGDMYLDLGKHLATIAAGLERNKAFYCEVDMAALRRALR